MRGKKEIIKLKEAFGKVKNEDFNFELIEGYFRKKDHAGSFQVLSDKTCQDLDFDELFMFLDRTNSKVGQQYLYDQLRTLSPSKEQVELREKLIQKFSSNPEFRIQIQRNLMKLNKEDVLYIPSLFQEEHARPPKWFFLVRIMAFASLVSIILFLFNSSMFLVVVCIFLINIGFHYWNKKNLHLYLGSIPQLLKLNSVARKLWITEAFREIDPKMEMAFRL